MSFIRSNSWRSGALLIGALFVGVPTAAGAATLHVPADYPTIQAGIDAAIPGDTVLVAPGTYSDYQIRYPDGFGWASCMFLKGGVAVRSVSGPGATFINLQALPKSEQPVGALGWYLAVGPTEIEGFTFLGGGVIGPAVEPIFCEAFSVVNCVFDRCSSFGGPGGAMISMGDASVINCLFNECKSFRAGAIEHVLGRLDLIECDFERCEGGAVEVAYDEGYVIAANVINCRFVDNTAGSGIGGFQMGNHGGCTMRGCLFLRNRATTFGNGGARIGNGPVVIEGCQFIENESPNGTSALRIDSNVTTKISNCTFDANVRVTPGTFGAISLASNITLENNIIAGTRGGFAVRVELLPIESSCNVFWDNPTGIGIPLTPTDRIADPLFCDPEADDYTLRAGSPCLPEDPLGCGLIGALGQGCGTISVESKSWGSIKSLYR